MACVCELIQASSTLIRWVLVSILPAQARELRCTQLDSLVKTPRQVRAGASYPAGLAVWLCQQLMGTSQNDGPGQKLTQEQTQPKLTQSFPASAVSDLMIRNRLK